MNKQFNASSQEKIKRLVWNKAHPQLGYDANLYRKDDWGWWICYTDYGNRSSDYGWELDHLTPVSEGGSDSLANLRPLHWRNNVARSNQRPAARLLSR